MFTLYCTRFGCYQDAPDYHWWYFVIAGVIIFGLACLIVWLQDKYGR